MDRPLRDVPESRHFHVAAPAIGSGTLELNAFTGRGSDATFVEVVLRDHWAGTWAGTAMADLVEALAVRLGQPAEADTSER